MDNTQFFQEQLDLARKNYIQKLPGTVQQLQELWKKVHTEQWDKGHLETFYHLVHKLTGSGTTFGFPLISRTARILEVVLQNIIESGIIPDHDANAQIDKYVRMLKQICEEASTSIVSSEAEGRGQDPSRYPTVWLLEEDKGLSETLSHEIVASGYRILVLERLDYLQEALRKAVPSLLIMNMALAQGKTFQIIGQTRLRWRLELPVILISSKDDLTTRLKAVRAGAAGYFQQPVDTQELLNKINFLTGRAHPQPYQILIVEDDTALVDYYSLVLQKAGMICKTVVDPLKTMEALADFKPDLMLFDINMPNCNGIELAAVMRQHKEYEKIPLIFLTTHPTPEHQAAALKVGADDLVAKPIDPQQLIELVSNRLRRWKIWQEQSQALKQSETKKLALEIELRHLQQEIRSSQEYFSEGELPIATTLLGSQGNSYLIEHVLGHGGMGVTYLALDQAARTKVVIKTLKPEIMTDLKVVMRFIQEAHTILKLQHPNLVQGYDFYHGKTFCYLVMEFIDGKSVEKMLEEEAFLDPVMATRIVAGIAKALMYLEEHRLVHRDIKPANIIIGAGGVPKLVDFGLVKINDRNCNLTTPRIILGTPYYLSPEQIYQSNVDVRSDIYSLGATYYHMVVGQVPFPGDHPMDVIQQHITTMPKPREVKPDLPLEICGVIEKMMALHKEKRQETAAELVCDLEAILNWLS